MKPAHILLATLVALFLVLGLLIMPRTPAPPQAQLYVPEQAIQHPCGDARRPMPGELPYWGAAPTPGAPGR
jgi:hypothetical protein